MSTKAIQEALEMLTTQVPPGTVVHLKAAEALREVEAIRKACVAIATAPLDKAELRAAALLVEAIAKEGQ